MSYFFHLTSYAVILSFSSQYGALLAAKCFKQIDTKTLMQNIVFVELP